MHRLTVDMGDEVTLTKPRFTGWATILHMPHHVVYSVDIRVTHVDTNGPQGEAILLASSVDDDGRPQAAEGWQEVPAWRRVPGGWVG